MDACRELKEQVAQMGPIVDQLMTMTGTARDAFNRHQRQCLADLNKQQEVASQKINAAIKQIEGLLSRASGTEKTKFLQLHSILSHLNAIGDNLAQLAGPLEQKIQGAVLFSDKAVAQTNYLFDHQAGILRSLIDIVHTDNQLLKKYVVEEGQKMRQSCLEFATEHEARLIEGLCLPQAGPIFLAILDRMQTIAQHELDIAGILTKQS
ncbi:MAG: hypothetical protein ACLFUU_11080 [Desulfobacteraceae bacterium]